MFGTKAPFAQRRTPTLQLLQCLDRLFDRLHRGPGDVTFDNVRPEVAHADGGRVSATATFSAPGEYVVRVQVNDSTGEGGGGFQCCWTNAYVKVTIK